MRLGEMTWTRVDEYLQTQEMPTILIPISPVEEHGPHLPLGTDYLLTERVAWLVAEQYGCPVFPTIPLMCCGISKDASGTYPIEGETLKGLVRDLVKEFARKGFKRIFFLSTHYGFSTERIREAIEEVRQVLSNNNLAIGIVQFNEVVAPKIRRGLIETAGDTHAGEIETSAVLALLPDLVGDLPPADFHEKVDGQPATLSRSGVNGDPTKATREKGEEIVRTAVEAVLEAIRT